MSPQSATQTTVIVEVLTLIESVNPPRWKGCVRIPDNTTPLDILIFNLDGGFWALPSHCPHQGYDLSLCPLVDGNSLVCPLHGERLTKDGTGFPVYETNGQFSAFVRDVESSKKTSNRGCKDCGGHDFEPADQLQDEIDHLRLANLKQERQIRVITQTMDAMLSESEHQKAALKEQVDKQHALTRFVESVMNTMDDLLFVVDKKGLILRINAAVERELGFAEAELLQRNIDNLLPPSRRQCLAGHLPELPWPVHSVLFETIQLNGQYSGEHELLAKHPDKPKSVYWLKSSLLFSTQGKLEGAVITAANITELKHRESQLRLSNKVFEQSCEAIFITDPQGTFLEVNAAFCAITGYRRHEVLGQNTRILKSHLHDDEFYQRLWQTLLSRGFWKGEIWDRRKNGEFCPMLTSISAICDDQGQITQFVAIATDISYQKQTEKELKQLAYYDVLTNLPNRALFKDRLEQEILLAKRKKNRLALFFLDLDHFKNINDSLGHWAGDHLLQVIATRIQSCLRQSDTVARLSGDEFTIILPGLTGIAAATELAQQLVNVVASPVQLKDHTVYVGVSIGIAVYPDDGEDFHTLTRHADTAMYASKNKGRQTFQYFEAGMNEAARQRLLLENALRQAIEHDEFQLYYQPKSDCTLSRITGAEALVRWHRPAFGMMGPDRFVAIAEETGLIIPIGEWILKTACLQAGVWAKKMQDFRVAINLSPRQLLADDFIDVLDAILTETRTDPNWIELEITESLLMHDLETATSRLKQIQERGIRVAMDDFGTGYSSLSYLKLLPIQTLKIDRSFVQAYNGNPASNEAAFIKTIVSLGLILNMTVVAEGVENQFQLELLQSYGCQVFQGYYLSPPVPKDEFQQRWLDHNSTAH